MLLRQPFCYQKLNLKLYIYTGKVARESFIGALNVKTNIIEKPLITIKSFFNFLHENTPWTWTSGHDLLFQQLKHALTTKTELTKPNTKLFHYNQCFIAVGASRKRLDAVLVQLNEDSNKKIISYNPCIFSSRTKIFHSRS